MKEVANSIMVPPAFVYDAETYDGYKERDHYIDSVDKILICTYSSQLPTQHDAWEYEFCLALVRLYTDEQVEIVAALLTNENCVYSDCYTRAVEDSIVERALLIE